MAFCEIVYAIYQKIFVINNYRNMHLSTISTTSGFIYTFVALVNDKENFHM